MFEWDEHKNKANIQKHGISFEMAIRVFLDNKRIEKLDLDHSTLNEERINIIGRAQGTMLILFVVATDRNGKTRIISARKAEPDEEAEYYENYDAR